MPKLRNADFRKIFKDNLKQKVKNVHPDPTDADRRTIVLKTGTTIRDWDDDYGYLQMDVVPIHSTLQRSISQGNLAKAASN